MIKEVILTGLRSNSEFHIGNYLGAIQPMVKLQRQKAGEYQMNMFIPDLHSFTTPIDHNKLYQQSIDNVKMFIAGGLDINQPDTFVYRQSFIPAHSEMTWILNCFTNFGELTRMTEFKSKAISEKELIQEYEKTPALDGDPHTQPDRKLAIAEEVALTKGVTASAGLFDYPVLMAADILLYGAKWVPVGDDQRQHLEFTRNLAIRINNNEKLNKDGDLFVIPKENAEQTAFSGLSQPVRIRSLRNPDKKMSKSVEDPAGTIMLSDSPDEAVKKVMGATTDDLGSINFDFEEQAGISNLLQILALLTNKPQSEVNAQWQGKSSYGELKTAVAAEITGFLSDFQAKLASVTDETVITKLEASEAAMSPVAGATLLKVQKAVGLRR